MLDYLCAAGESSGRGPPNIALLTESLTTYGTVGAGDPALLRAQVRRVLAAHRRPPVDLAAAAGGDGTGNASASFEPRRCGESATELSERPRSRTIWRSARCCAISARGGFRFVGVVVDGRARRHFLADRIRQQLPDVRCSR